MTNDESHFVYHLPCSACGSSDANAMYSDGHTFCWKCRAFNRSAEQAPPSRQRPKANPVLIQTLEFRDLPARKLTEATCRKFGYGVGREYDNGQQYQVAPYYNADGQLVGQKLRGKGKTFSCRGDMKSALLFGQQLWRDAGKRVVITEGEIDAMSVSQIQENKWPVVSVPSGAQSAADAVAAQIEWLEQFEEVVFMFDMDEPGRKAAIECAMQLSPGKAKIASLPLHDANDCLKAGRTKEVVDAIWGAKTYRPDGIVSGDDIWAHLTKPRNVQSIKFPHSGLNALTHGMRPGEGEVVLFVAGTGAGKSTLVRETAYHIVQQGERVGYLALEESVQRSAIGLCSIALNKPLHLNTAAFDHDELKRAFDTFRDQVVFYDHFGSLESEHLLHKIRFMVRGLGCRFVVLDHLSIVVSGMDANDDERRALDKMMTNLASLGQELSCCILVVCHLKKSDGKAHEEGRAVSMSDIRGSHGIPQLSHTIISLERDQQSETEKHISLARVLKCRWTGDTGKAGHFRYDKETGRLEETTLEFGETSGEEADEVAY